MSEYTPTTDEVREDFAYPWEGFKQNREGRLAAFDRWHEAEITAAEQRGAVKALKDFRRFMVRAIRPGLTNRDGLIADIDESLKRLDETGYMLMGPLNRADRIEEATT